MLPGDASPPVGSTIHPQARSRPTPGNVRPAERPDAFHPTPTRKTHRTTLTSNPKRKAPESALGPFAVQPSRTITVLRGSLSRAARGL
jgi:hypothetical protein